MLKRKILVVLVLAIFLLGTGTLAAANQVFNDVPGNHWAANDIARMQAKGVLMGVSATNYAPNDPVTREMLVVMLVRILDKQDEATGTIPVSFTQRDRVSGYAVGSMAFAVREGIISGNLLNSDPRAPVPRHEVAMIVTRAMGITDEAAVRQNASLNFVDAATIPSGSRGYVAVMQERGIMGGGADGRFTPNDPLTRAQIAAILNRIDNQVGALTDNTTIGRITGVSSSALTIENAAGTMQQINLAPNALVFRLGVISRVVDLTPGQTVEIITDSAGRALYINQGNFEFNQVRVVEGEITEIMGQNLLLLTIAVDGGNTNTYTLSATATIRIDNQNATSSQLAQGQIVRAEITGTVINSIQVSNEQRIINGTISDINVSERTITVERVGNLGEIRFNVDNNTVIQLERRDVYLRDLVVEQDVTVIARGNRATRIDARDLRQTITGELIRVSFTPDVTITVLNNVTNREGTYRVAEDVDIRRDRTRNLTLRDIFPGEEIDIDLGNGVVTHITASREHNRVEGIIREVRIGATPTLVIVTDDGTEETHPIAHNARIRRDGLNVSINEIQFGEWARLELEGRQAVRVDVEAAHINRYLIGTVENIHNAAQVIVVSELETRENRQVFWDSDTVVIRDNRVRYVSNLRQRDEVVIIGRTDGGIFWANTIMITASGRN